MEYLTLFLLCIVQNAAFTLVSRARNSSSILYHGVASVFSNGIWLLVAQRAILKPDDHWNTVAYVSGAVVGSLLMHWFVLRFIEKKKNV